MRRKRKKRIYGRWSAAPILPPPPPIEWWFPEEQQQPVRPRKGTPDLNLSVLPTFPPSNYVAPLIDQWWMQEEQPRARRRRVPEGTPFIAQPSVVSNNDVPVEVLYHGPPPQRRRATRPDLDLFGFAGLPTSYEIPEISLWLPTEMGPRARLRKAAEDLGWCPAQFAPVVPSAVTFEPQEEQPRRKKRLPFEESVEPAEPDLLSLTSAPCPCDYIPAKTDDASESAARTDDQVVLLSRTDDATYLPSRPDDCQCGC